jgi:hypothetical protein
MSSQNQTPQNQDHVEDHVKDHVEDHVEDQVEDQVEGQVEDQVEDQVEGQAEDQPQSKIDLSNDTYFYVALVPNRETYIEKQQMVLTKNYMQWMKICREMGESLHQKFFSGCSELMEIEIFLRLIAPAFTPFHQAHCTLFFSSGLTSKSVSILCEKYGQNGKSFDEDVLDPCDLVLKFNGIEGFSRRNVVVLVGELVDVVDSRFTQNAYKAHRQLRKEIQQHGGTLGDVFVPHSTILYVDKLWEILKPKLLEYQYQYPRSFDFGIEDGDSFEDHPWFADQVMNAIRTNQNLMELIRNFVLKLPDSVVETW